MVISYRLRVKANLDKRGSEHFTLLNQRMDLASMNKVIFLAKRRTKSKQDKPCKTAKTSRLKVEYDRSLLLKVLLLAPIYSGWPYLSCCQHRNAEQSLDASDEQKNSLLMSGGVISIDLATANFRF